MPTSPKASVASPTSSRTQAEHLVTTAPFGSWSSPITADLIVSKSVSIGDVHVGGSDVWWSEARPEEGGRIQLVRHRPGRDAVDVLPEGFGARTRVHEYGGGAWWLHGDDVVFVNWADQRLYRLAGGTDHPVALTPEPAAHHADRYADGRFTADGRWIVCVRERHAEGAEQAINEIVAVRVHHDGAPGEPVVLVSGSDFVASPRVNADGNVLAWFRWDHPDMPWDGTELCVASMYDDQADGGEIVVGDTRVVAGGRDESISQPEWMPDGSLLFISDRTDWWNLYRVDAADVRALVTSGSVPEPAPIAPIDAEIGIPHWVFDASRYAVLADGRILVAWFRHGIDHLGVIPAGGGAMVPLGSPFTALSSLRAFGYGAVLIGASPTTEAVVAVIDIPASPDIDGSSAVLINPISDPRDLGLGAEWFSVPESITFATSGDRFAHGLFYPPTNPGFDAPERERAPLIVLSHGGPTSAARPQLNLGVQYWTSRGFGVVDVNYGGSTGYGRSYRRRLIGEWGIVDVDDSVAATRFLIDRGDADRDRLIIRGGSAGGYTTLCALTFREVFAAGCSLYGVADLEALARDTHKFEARYLDSLVGPWPARSDIYTARSPIHHVEDLECPLIVLQGMDDEIVPPNQAEMMVEALEANGVPWAYLAFEGEGHGFRQAATIKRALEAEAYFYSRILGFELADEVEPIVIANL
jgi:dipeptidyl aminopeptidase/acylaminoacyl peptidase